MPDPIAPPAPARPRRHWPRLSLRGLMVLVLLLGGGLGYLVHGARVQRDAIAAIEASGGSWRYDWQAGPGGLADPKGRAPAPKWLMDAVGPDYFGAVVAASLGPNGTDADFARVGRLSRLVLLNANPVLPATVDRSASNPAITDAGAAHLAGLPGLVSVSLARTGVTGRALAYLDAAAGLTRLRLAGTRVGDADLAHLARHPALVNLDLSETPVTDAGLAPLRGLARLVECRLGDTAVTGTGLAHLPAGSGLQKLYLPRTRVADLAALPPLPKLDLLDLEGTPIADAGLAALPALPRLAVLVLAGTPGWRRSVAHRPSGPSP